MLKLYKTTTQLLNLTLRVITKLNLGDIWYKSIGKEVAEAIEERVNHNKSLVQKLAKFIYDKFSIGKNPEIDVKDCSAFKFYQAADKELLGTHLQELTKDSKGILSKVENYINDNYFALTGVCKQIQPQEITDTTHISRLPVEIMEYIFSSKEQQYSLWEVKLTGGVFEVDAGAGESYS